MGFVIIPLSSNKQTLIDVEDAPAMNKYRWFYSAPYARTKRARHTVTMHRVLMGERSQTHLEVDHKNRNQLDNRRSNLRLVTHAQNMRNLTPQKGKSSRFRGVDWKKDMKKWRARARYRNQENILGYFLDEEQASEVVESFWANVEREEGRYGVKFEVKKET